MEDLRTWGDRACLVSRGRPRSSGVVALRMIDDGVDGGGGGVGVIRSTCRPTSLSGAGDAMTGSPRNGDDVSFAVAGRTGHRRLFYRPA